ncbi:MAG: RluA family pseudouridine synthase [Candidatus Moranbacteria bacterium]|nr:RluA family pseudouridine synthase [Candidatus Moranbacteria bacterium]
MPLFSSQDQLIFEVPRHLKDKRIDSTLATLLREKYPEEKTISRAVLTRVINEGKVLLNGAPVLARSLVATHDQISFAGNIFGGQKQLTPAYGDIAVTVLFENDRLLVLDKGAGVQMHHGGSHPGTTLSEWLLGHYPFLKDVGGDPLRPGIVHRLDRDTSGVVVIAKDNETFQALKKAFQDRLVDKKYVALVYGQLSALEGKIDASLIRHPGDLKRRAVDTEEYTGTLPGNTRTALTLYRVLARYAEYDVVELSPKTGRTHQIRVHMTYLGHPVVGDKLYAFKEVKRSNLLAPNRHMLHAGSLSFELFGEKYQFQSPLPEDFRQVLMSLDETQVSSYDDEALKTCPPRFA